MGKSLRSGVAVVFRRVNSAVIPARRRKKTVGAEFISRTSRLKPESALGILYTTAYAVSLAVLALGRVRVDLEHWLFGDIFVLGNADLWQLWAVALGVVPLLVALERSLTLTVCSEPVARGVPIVAHVVEADDAEWRDPPTLGSAER